jgi:protein TonB
LAEGVSVQSSNPSLPRAQSFEVEKRVFLGVAAALIGLLLLPWRFGEDAPAYRMVLIEEPHYLEERPLPDLPPPPVVTPPVTMPKVVLPEVTPEPMEIPPEEVEEPEAERLEPAPLAEPRQARPRRPPASRAQGPVKEGRAGLIKPQLLHAPTPDYPRACLATGRGGQVIIEALIDQRGRVSSVELLQRADCSALDQAALEAVRERRYEPGRLEGRAVEVLAIIRVDSRLN